MGKLLKGHIVGKGYGVAGLRLKACEQLLAKYGILFPPMYPGTINIKLLEPFPTPNDASVIYISQEEIDKVDPGWQEWWKFIPVGKINNKDIQGYIFRNRQHVHGDDGAELVTIDLRGRSDFDLSPGQQMDLFMQKPKVLTPFQDEGE